MQAPFSWSYKGKTFSSHLGKIGRRIIGQISRMRVSRIMRYTRCQLYGVYVSHMASRGYTAQQCMSFDYMKKWLVKENKEEEAEMDD